MVKNTPPLGWNSWNTFGHNINEELIKEVADAMVNTGLLECGYDYLVIDDCWQKRSRDQNGRLVPDENKFPNGMKAVADYVHSKGLKFGIYSCVGMLTCEGFPGSFEHEFVDAQTFAEWGVDFLKYDFCYRPYTIPGHILYKRMGLALASCGRDILFSACSWGAEGTKEWIRTTGANMWRSTGDINDSWASIKFLALKQSEILDYAGINCFNDMDMLVVGMNGYGNVGLGGCTKEEYRLHFSLWALLGSPLMIGCDIRNMNNDTKEILMNKDVIAINQDPAGRQAYEVGTLHEWTGPSQPIYIKHLDGGDIAVGFFNMSDEKSNMALALDRIGLPESSGKTLKLTELWTNEEYVCENGVLILPVEAHDCKLFRAKIINK